MTTENLKKRIEINPDVLVGKPVIKGTRIAVEHIMGYLAGGMTEKEILENFPRLAKEDIQAAILYATELVRDLKVYPREFIRNVHIAK
jgi:uncharacterized protein (DUF433 family)